MSCSERRTEALQAHVREGGPEGEIAARTLKAMGLPLEGQPVVDVVIQAREAVDRDLAVLVARLCGVEVMCLRDDNRRLWLRGPRSIATPAADMYRAERKAMHRRRQLSDIAFINSRFGHLQVDSDPVSNDLSPEEVKIAVGMSYGIDRASQPRKRLTEES